jgi:membrane protein
MTTSSRGRQASTPTEVPAQGWWDIFVRTAKEAKADGVSLLAAGVAFFGLLALVPALAATVGFYGMFADPATAGDKVEDLLGAAPAEVRDLVRSQLESITESPNRQAGIAAIVGLALALWSASAGMKHLLEAINRAYDESESRRFVKLRGLAILLTLGAIAFLLATVLVITVLPAALADSSLEGPARTVINIARWPLLAAAMAFALGVLYRWGPDRDEPKWRWTSTGSVIATVLWLGGSALFSLYAANFATYNETYGSLGAVVVAMLWLYLTAYAVIIGAEINAEAERQTVVDTTEGRHRPLGHRGAHAADTVGPTAQEVRSGTPPDTNMAGTEMPGRDDTDPGSGTRRPADR